MSTPPKRITYRRHDGFLMEFHLTAHSKTDGKTLCTYSTDDGKLKADVALDDNTLESSDESLVVRALLLQLAANLASASK